MCKKARQLDFLTKGSPKLLQAAEQKHKLFMCLWMDFLITLFYCFAGLENVRMGTQFWGANTQNKEQGNECIETDSLFKFGHLIYLVMRSVLGKFKY